jgi:hypothetical protein
MYKIFDWDKAARLIKEKKPKMPVLAGIKEDWHYTFGAIYDNGEIINDSSPWTYSNLYTPQMVINREFIECWIYAKEELIFSKDELNHWTESAINILNGNDIPIKVDIKPAIDENKSIVDIIFMEPI